MTVRAGARIVWDKPRDERLEYAEQFVGQEVALHWNSFRSSRDLNTELGTVVAVAVPTGGQADEVVLARPGKRYAIAFSLAHVHSIERRGSSSSKPTPAELEEAGQLAIEEAVNAPAGQNATAALAGKLLPSWHPAPGTRYFRSGDTVRVDGMVGRRFVVQGFRLSATEGWTAELVGARGDKQADQLRTVTADRLRRP